MILLVPEIYPTIDIYGACSGCVGGSVLHFNPHRPEITPYFVCPIHGIQEDSPKHQVVYGVYQHEPIQSGYIAVTGSAAGWSNTFHVVGSTTPYYVFPTLDINPGSVLP